MSAKDEPDDIVVAVQKGYAFDGPALELGALVVAGTGWSRGQPAPARPRRCS
jgi:hypothetical protein